MPELPEVETVRDGLARHVLDHVVTRVEVRRGSAVRRQHGGVEEFTARLTGRTLSAAVRRGKFLWLLLDAAPDDPVELPDDALLAHLGMSGQLLVREATDAVEHPHLRARLHLDGPVPLVLDFVDQRTFGALAVTDLVRTADGAPAGHGSEVAALPGPVAHIGRDLLDPHLDRPRLVAALRRRRTDLKRALLDQTLVSGVGNIYADEALWRASMHPLRPTQALRPVQVVRVLDEAELVMREALAAGGTSFDALYVNVNGASGYFDRSLAVYGQEGRPCPRCGTPVRRQAFMNRSSFTCPRCQPAPRAGRAGAASGRSSRMADVVNAVPPPARTSDIAVMIVDDHEVVRRGIAEVVDRSEGMSVVAEAGSVAEGVRRATLVRPQVMLVDLQLPDGTGIDLMTALRDVLPGTRAIVLTSFDDDDALAAALKAGAAAYVLKSVRGAEIADVIRSVAAGRTLLDERTITRRQADHDDPTADLTPSERKVVELIGDGMSNREIAERLGVAEKTVKNHITSLLAKMGLQRRTQVAAWVAGHRHSAWRGETD